MERSASRIIKLGRFSDPRHGESVYPLVNVLFMLICGVIAGADDLVAIAKFAFTEEALVFKALRYVGWRPIS